MNNSVGGECETPLYLAQVLDSIFKDKDAIALVAHDVDGR
jgi:hypothetical protein